MSASQKLLIVEDSKVMADVLRFHLLRSGYEVDIAANGRIGWDQLSHQRYDLLVTDFQMPEIQGDELCRLVRESPLNHEIPIILVSAKGYELDVEGMKADLGINEVVFKPFSPRAVVETVQRVLHCHTNAFSA